MKNERQADIIRRIRSSHNLSQEKLAAKLGYKNGAHGKAVICEIESGKRKIPFNKLQKLTKYVTPKTLSFCIRQDAIDEVNSKLEKAFSVIPDSDMNEKKLDNTLEELLLCPTSQTPKEENSTPS